ncbi:MAG: MerC domain-containing protein [Flavobacteriales bacterium]|jgi:hypothetical protein|nr:MerC domain-containing protein [Flavobacteriales bacterium]
MFSRSADVFGAFASLACAIHCLAMPLLLSVGATFLTGHFIAYLFILFAALAIRSASHDASKNMRMAMWGTWMLFATSIVLEHQHVLFEVLGIGASLLLAVLHVLNFRSRARCATPHPA